MTAEFEAHDALWDDAVTIAEEAAEKANAQIQAQCALLGIPAQGGTCAALGWRSRGRGYGDSSRRAELRKLAETRLAALTKMAKTAIQAAALDIEEKLIMGGLELR